MIVQIYEIQTPKEAERCIELGVDHIGSVLLSGGEWRIAQIREVMRLTEGTGVKNSLIPLFQDMDTLQRCLDYYRPHYVHFCESLADPDGLEIDLDQFTGVQSNLKERFPEIGIMRSIPTPRKGAAPGFSTLKVACVLKPVTDIFLIDTWLGQEPVEGYVGITGRTADWDIARELVLESEIPVILAGGLSPENVYGAIMKVFPCGADSCTHTNRINGKGKPIRFQKDFHRVDQFVKEVRRAEEVIQVKNQDQTSTRD